MVLGIARRKTGVTGARWGMVKLCYCSVLIVKREEDQCILQLWI